jgi:hypothetical protein
MPRESQTTAPQRRSPIKKPPLRTAGQSLREQMLDLLFGRWLSYALALAVVWLLVLLDWLRLALRVPWSWKSCVAMTSFAAAFSALAFLKMRGTDGEHHASFFRLNSNSLPPRVMTVLMPRSISATAMFGGGCEPFGVNAT